MENKKIVLTGGPCGGKTTSIQKIEQEFTEIGYQVLIVPEAATLLINSGIRPFGKNALSMYDFQKCVIKTQLYLENLSEECSKKSSSPTLILCDRGIMDDKAYVSQENFEKLLSEFHLSSFQIMNSYDLVIHLKTAADGKEEFYTLENNKSRTETKEEAREKDKKTLNSWLGHDNLKIIGNDTNFDTKINKVIQEIHYLTDKKYPIQKQEKYLVEFDKEQLLKNNPVIHKIEQYIITDDKKEYLYRKTTREKESKYTLITKIDTDINNERIVLRRNITEEEYLTNLDKEKTPLQKIRYCFTYKNQYFRLDEFKDGLKILEIEDSNKTKKRDIPSFIKIQEDISNNLEYRNKNLYDCLNIQNKTLLKK